MAIERHHPGIAQRDLALGFAGIGVLADRDELVAVLQQAPVAGRIGGTEAEHGEPCAVGERRAHPREGAGGDQRRVAKDDQQIVRTSRNRRTRGQRRMRRSETLALNENIRARPQAFRLLLDGTMIGSDDHGNVGVCIVRCRSQDMRKQRFACNGMQHFGQGRTHPRAFARREHNCQAGSSGHASPRVGTIV